MSTSPTFFTLLSKILAAKATGWDEKQQNMRFVHTLTNTTDPEEAELWMSFYTFTSRDMYSMKLDVLYSQARNWDQNQIAPKLKHHGKSSINSDYDAEALATQTQFHATSNKYHMHDLNKFCFYHRHPGHDTYDCETAKRDPAYLDWLNRDNDDSNSSVKPHAAAVRAELQPL